MEKSVRRFYALLQLFGKKTGGKDKICDPEGIITGDNLLIIDQPAGG